MVSNLFNIWIILFYNLFDIKPINNPINIFISKNWNNYEKKFIIYYKFILILNLFIVKFIYRSF